MEKQGLHAAVRAPECVVLPGDDGWDEARLAWNLAADQRPEAVALPTSVEELAEVIRWAADSGLRVAPQGTGHMAAAVGDLDGAVLVKLSGLRGVSVDPDRRVARAAAGTIWIEVVDAAAEHGLAALSGSSPDVGVVGYTLGGGLSWLARKHGIGANHVTAIEVVTADGAHRRVDADNDPDLFWALRGGGGAFGVVTAIELSLLPYRSVHAGHLWFPVERAAEVLRAWRDWTETVPEEMTSVGRVLQFPPLPEIPEPMRGNSFAVLQAIYCGDDVDEANRLLEPLRALAPAMDTFADLPMPALTQLHMDPDHPVPGHGDGQMLDALPDEAIDLFVETVVGKPLLAAELRHLGGAVARAEAGHGAAASFAAPYISWAVGIVPVPEARPAVAAAVSEFVLALEPWSAAVTYLNFAEGGRDPRNLWPEETLARLRSVKERYDPDNLFRSSHELA